MTSRRPSAARLRCAFVIPAHPSHPPPCPAGVPKSFCCRTNGPIDPTAGTVGRPTSLHRHPPMAWRRLCPTVTGQLRGYACGQARAGHTSRCHSRVRKLSVADDRNPLLCRAPTRIALPASWIWASTFSPGRARLPPPHTRLAHAPETGGNSFSSTLRSRRASWVLRTTKAASCSTFSTTNPAAHACCAGTGGRGRWRFWDNRRNAALHRWRLCEPRAR